MKFISIITFLAAANAARFGQDDASEEIEHVDEIESEIMDHVVAGCPTQAKAVYECYGDDVKGIMTCANCAYMALKADKDKLDFEDLEMDLSQEYSKCTEVCNEECDEEVAKFADCGLDLFTKVADGEAPPEDTFEDIKPIDRIEYEIIANVVEECPIQTEAVIDCYGDDEKHFMKCANCVWMAFKTEEGVITPDNLEGALPMEYSKCSEECNEKCDEEVTELSSCGLDLIKKVMADEQLSEIA